MPSVLFVCLGNICRSPTAEGAFRKLLRERGMEGTVLVDSAGTHAYHVGNPPDQRACEAASRRGLDLAPLRARAVTQADFSRFDWILAMDSENLTNLQRMCPPEHRHKLFLFLEFAKDRPEREVPDPYYGGGEGFEHVLDLVQAAAEGLLEEVIGVDAR